MNKIRALVVDDEPLARERVLTLLQQETDDVWRLAGLYLTPWTG